ncbi:hypothetical protein [Microbacterium sp. KR10-403]|uniref:hypothetical protein n=1 Tax=Microbacterium sp. KR10-403 TaxID=3158581 RepID=UPI0032E3C896
MTIEQEAREAAEKAAFESHNAPTWDDPVARDAAIRWHMRGFEAGVQWQAQRPVTDAEVEKAARAMAILGDYDGCFERLDGTAPEGPMSTDAEDADWWRARARAALEAAREETNRG